MPKPKPGPEEIAQARQYLNQRLSTVYPEIEILDVYRVGGGSRPHVARVRVGEQVCVLKDHSGCDPMFARLLGPLLARRECRALIALENVDGVPDFIEKVDKRAFLMSDVCGRPYRQVPFEKQEWRTFFSELEQLIRAMHEQGVCHCDLRSLDNTLVDESGHPAVVDFVASFHRPRFPNPVSMWMFRRFKGVDLSALDKQKKSVAPWLLEGQREVYDRDQESMIPRMARNFGVLVRKVSRALFTRRR